MNIKDEHNAYEAMMEKQDVAREAICSDDAELCETCNGSGEGQHDGTECGACGGKGLISTW